MIGIFVAFKRNIGIYGIYGIFGRIVRFDGFADIRGNRIIPVFGINGVEIAVNAFYDGFVYIIKLNGNNGTECNYTEAGNRRSRFNSRRALFCRGCKTLVP